jgi:hypothetical protein
VRRHVAGVGAQLVPIAIRVRLDPVLAPEAVHLEPVGDPQARLADRRGVHAHRHGKLDREVPSLRAARQPHVSPIHPRRGVLRDGQRDPHGLRFARLDGHGRARVEVVRVRRRGLAQLEARDLRRGFRDLYVLDKTHLRGVGGQFRPAALETERPERGRQPSMAASLRAIT